MGGAAAWLLGRMAPLRRPALVLAVAWLAILALVYPMQRRMLFLPDPERVSPASVRLEGFAEETLTTPDGERLVAWWRAPRGDRPVVLYFHGNGGNLSYRAGRYGALGDAGFGVLAISYRGYGGSTGSPSERALVADGRQALGHLRAKGVPARRIVVFGESLGSGVAVQVAAAERVGGVILDSPFTSAADVAARQWWFLPVHLLMWDRFDSLARITEIGAPLLVLHGDRDGIVPYDMGQRLYAAALEPKAHVTLPGAGHTAPIREGAWPHIRAFLERIEAAR